MWLRLKLSELINLFDLICKHNYFSNAAKRYRTLHCRKSMFETRNGTHETFRCLFFPETSNGHISETLYSIRNLFISYLEIRFGNFHKSTIIMKVKKKKRNKRRIKNRLSLEFDKNKSETNKLTTRF